MLMIAVDPGKVRGAGIDVTCDISAPASKRHLKLVSQVVVPMFLICQYSRYVPGVAGAVKSTATATCAWGGVIATGTPAGVPIAVPPAGAHLYPGPQVSRPRFCSFHTLRKCVPGRITWPSGTETSF